jgi:hypothetical protein
MILDSRNEFSDAAAVTATAISNVIDTGAAAGGLGALDDLYLVIGVDTAVTAAGAATVTFSLESDSTADLATSATVHWQSAAIGKATLVAGFNVVVLELPKGFTHERYLGVRYTVATGPLTAGKFNAFLTPDPSVCRAFDAPAQA